jgi:thioredoxin 1
MILQASKSPGSLHMNRVFDTPINANDQSLERLLAAPIPVMILFWSGADLSGPANQAIADLASREAGGLIVARIDAGENPQAVRRFAITHTPVLVSVKAGQELARVQSPTEREIDEHSRYVLGRGPQPGLSSQAQASPRAETRPVHVADAAFEQMVLKARIPVLVDFWAPWCGPCHAIAPILDKLAREFAGRIRVAKVNVDENPHYAGIYGIQGIPTLLLVHNGQVIDRVVGIVPEQYLRAKVEHQLLRQEH